MYVYEIYIRDMLIMISQHAFQDFICFFLLTGKPRTDNIYCKVTLGDQEQQTTLAKETLVPANQNQNRVPQVPVLIWNYSMQFHIRHLEEVLTFTVYESCLYTPDGEQNIVTALLILFVIIFLLIEFLGKAELRLAEVHAQHLNTNGPLTKKLILHQVESGEIVVKLDLQMFTNSY